MAQQVNLFEHANATIYCFNKKIVTLTVEKIVFRPQGIEMKGLLVKYLLEDEIVSRLSLLLEFFLEN